MNQDCTCTRHRRCPYCLGMLPERESRTPKEPLSPPRELAADDSRSGSTPYWFPFFLEPDGAR